MTRMAFARSDLRRSLFAFLALALVPAAAHAQALATRGLQKAGMPPKLAARAARHVLLGLPSEASRTNDKDFLLVRNGYVLSYNADRNAMNWASWAVEKGDLGNVPRQRWRADKSGEQVSVFRADPTLPQRFYKPDSGDYVVEPGYTRGHMVRSGERTASIRENRKTFMFTNMLPQSVNNNNGPWNTFENYYRDVVTNEGLVAHVIAGGIFGKAPVAARHVAVPSETWKIVAFLKPGQTEADVDAKTRVVAIRMPNDNVNIQVEDKWENYRVPVADLETATGLRFFSHLAPPVAQALKARADSAPIVAPAPRALPVPNHGEKFATTLVAAQQRGTVKFYAPEKGYGLITMADGKELFFHRDDRLTSLRDGEAVELDIGARGDGRQVANRVRSLSPKAAAITP